MQPLPRGSHLTAMLRSGKVVFGLCSHHHLLTSSHKITKHAQRLASCPSRTAFNRSNLQRGLFSCHSVTETSACDYQQSNTLQQLAHARNYSTDLAADWTVQERLVTVCADLWDDHPAGSNCIVSYIDTAAHLTKSEQSRMPTVLSVARDRPHSESLMPLLKSLAQDGFRVVMPYMPGSGLTRGVSSLDEACFSNFLGERSAFLLDFIAAINIQRFDVAIGHSTECFPVLTLASNFNLIDSVVFLCPVPGHVPPRWIRPLKISLTMLSLYKSSLSWPVAALWFHTYVRHCVSTLSSPTASELNLLVEISHGLNYDTLPGLIMGLEAQRTPLLYAFCDGDRMVDCKHSAEYAEMFDLTPATTDLYDASCTLIEKAVPSSKVYKKALRFTAATHFPQMDDRIRPLLVKEIKELVYQSALSKKSLKNSFPINNM